MQRSQSVTISFQTRGNTPTLHCNRGVRSPHARATMKQHRSRNIIVAWVKSTKTLYLISIFWWIDTNITGHITSAERIFFLEVVRGRGGTESTEMSFIEKFKISPKSQQFPGKKRKCNWFLCFLGSVYNDEPSYKLQLMYRCSRERGDTRKISRRIGPEVPWYWFLFVFSDLQIKTQHSWRELCYATASLFFCLAAYQWFRLVRACSGREVRVAKHLSFLSSTTRLSFSILLACPSCWAVLPIGRFSRCTDPPLQKPSLPTSRI